MGYLRTDFKKLQQEFAELKTEPELQKELEKFKELRNGEHISDRQYWAIEELIIKAKERLRFGDRHLKSFERVGGNGYRIKD